MRDRHGSTPAKYTLPTDLDPAESRCFMVTVPDEPMYIAAFRGALWRLSRWYAWDEDAAHNGKVAAARMEVMWDGIEEIDCMGIADIRVSETGCGIEIRRFGSSIWEALDLSSCIGSLVQDGIVTAVSEGVVQTPGEQQSPSAPPPSGECHTYHVILHAADRWHCPSPVAAADTVHVTNAKGGWYDGHLAPYGAWYCPDGRQYVLGICDTNTPFTGTDPYLGGNHMQIVGNFGTTFFDPLSAYTIPGGTPQSELFMQANDEVLTDNQGSVEFDVTVCSNAFWTHVFEGSTLHNWILGSEGGLWSTDHWTKGAANKLYIYKNLPVITGGHYLNLISVTDPVSWTGNTSWRLYPNPDRGGTTLKETKANSFSFPANISGGGSILWSENTTDPLIDIYKVTITGTGIDPF